MPFRLHNCTALLCLLLFSLARADDFVWPRHGTISFAVPKGWALKGKPIDVEDAGYAFQARPVSGSAAIAQITLLQSKPDHPFTRESASAAFTGMVQEFVAGSVEQKVVSLSLEPEQGYGWFCQFTDASLVGKPPVPDDYKCQYNALLVLSDHVGVVATLQFDDPDKPEPAAMLTLLKSMHFVAEKSASPSESRDSDRVKITLAGKLYEISFPPAHALLTMPKEGFVEAVERIGGGTENPSYFKLNDETSGMIISGWFEPAQKFPGVDDFWKGFAGELKREGAPETKDVEFQNIGEWRTEFYDYELEGTGNSHLKAELVRNGAWIDLHLSITSHESEKVRRQKLHHLMDSIVVNVGP
jgi:hypothetical protein